MKWVDKHIEIDPPKRTKKITGTRFATILGLNPWATDFEIWCAVTKTFEIPFEDTIYTIAGKTIEPKQIAYMKKSYGMDNVIMIASFLESKDYDHPEKFKPSAKNTITVEFKLSERYPDFADKEKRLKTINDLIKEHAMSRFRDGDKKVEVTGSKYVWSISRSNTTTVDKEALKADGLLDKYSKTAPSYRMTVKEV